MCIAAAHALAQSAEKRGLSEDNIAPTMWEAEAYVSEAVATGMKAQEQGVARISRSAEELRQSAETAIRRAQELTAFLMKEGFIAPAPQE